MSGGKLATASTADLKQLASLIAVPLPTFTQVFIRAQQGLDSIYDLSEVGSNAADDYGRIVSCFAFAKKKGFLKRLLTTGLEEKIAGAPGSSTSNKFARLAERLGLKLDQLIQPGAYETFKAQAINAGGFDTDPMRLYGLVRTAMRSVCKITDTENQSEGTGVLIAPHLVATAAHVVASQIDEHGRALPGSAAKLSIRMDLVADLPGADSRPIPVDDDWLVDCSLGPAGMIDPSGRLGTLPPESGLENHEDLAVIRLKEAPGYLRGWLEIADPTALETNPSKGLIFHHHPSGGEQKVSVGKYCARYGPRFKHDCSSMGGSSGGPLINTAARIAGVHHGTISPKDRPEINLGGGGAQLLRWRDEHKLDYEAPTALNPIWEIRKTGAVGSGQPVIGFEELQRKIWEVELAGKSAAMFVQGTNYAGRLVFDIVEAMLPADRAIIVRFDRVLLNDIITALSVHAGDESQTAIAIVEIAQRISHLEGSRPDRHSTDPIEARAAAPMIGKAFSSLPADRSIWTLVNIGDLDVPTPLSEALTYLYHACLRIEGKRGRLVIAGADDRVRAKVASLVRDVLEDDIGSNVLRNPDASAVERYFLRYGNELKIDILRNPDVARMMAQTCLSLATAEAGTGTDFYSSLENVVKHFRPTGP